MRQEKKDDKRKKRQQSILEAEIMAFMQKSMKTALQLAMDDIFKDFKYFK